jgi:uncharacterized protein (DUF2141 family)
MLNKRLPAVAFLSALVLDAAATSEVNTLAVSALGFTHGRGHAVAKLFLPGDNVRGAGRTQAVADIRDGQAAFEFKGLAGGAYAVVVFHDENDNGKIDHNALGWPSEPIGFSNGFTLGLFSGLPSFEKLRFDYLMGKQTLEVLVK